MKTVYHPETGAPYTGESVDCREMVQLHGYREATATPAASSGLPAPQPAPVAQTMQEQLDTALGKLPSAVEAGTYKDPEYVVTQMREHFGELFTDDVEAKVREAFPAPKKAKGKKE